MISYRGMNYVQLWRLLQWWFIHLGPTRDVTVDTFNGRLSFSSGDWLIGKYLYVKRAHEEHEIQSVIGLLTREGWLKRSPTTVLNAGANIGMTCIGLVREKFDRAIAFEPDPRNYRLLVRNIEQNGLRDRIQAFPVALSSTTGHVTLELSKDNPGDHRVRQTDRPGFYKEETRPTIQVEADTLDHFFQARPGAVDVIWVDIQGHEGHFFRGAKNFLKRGIPVVSEFWPYGLERAGTSAAEYTGLVSESFSHFWVVDNADYQRVPIEEFGKLFELYQGPRSFGLVVFAPRAGQAAQREPAA